jgi:hypothetical protein
VHALAKAALASKRNDAMTQALAVASTGAAAGPPFSAREARQELADSEDAVDAARAALSACQAAMSDAEDDLRATADRVEGAIVTILTAQADRLTCWRKGRQSRPAAAVAT